MLERILGRTGDFAPPKNQIELICPVCGSVQREPRMVLTTLCRNCGDHLRIEKNGLVVASARVVPTPSSVYPAMPEAGRTIERTDADVVVSERTLKVRNAPSALARSPGLRENGVTSHSSTNGHNGGGAALPLPQTTLHRMRDMGGSRQHYFKEIECFDCGNRFKVGRSARSACCTMCQAPICLEDVEIDGKSINSIRTRGDVHIRKTGNIQAVELRCRDLKLFGSVSAAIQCSGEFHVQASGHVVGEVRCRRLLIDAGCDIHFKNNIFAEEVEVRGRIHGQIQCSGSVCITSTGLVQGDVKARAVSIDPGGQLDGAMNIVRKAVARAE